MQCLFVGYGIPQRMRYDQYCMRKAQNKHA